MVTDSSIFIEHYSKDNDDVGNAALNSTSNYLYFQPLFLIIPDYKCICLLNKMNVP
jgi:hypothetical protein